MAENENQSNIITSLDFSKISTNEYNVKNENYVKVARQYWGDTNDLTYKIQNDVAYIYEGNTLMGMTSKDNINNGVDYLQGHEPDVLDSVVEDVNNKVFETVNNSASSSNSSYINTHYVNKTFATVNNVSTSNTPYIKTNPDNNAIEAASLNSTINNIDRATYSNTSSIISETVSNTPYLTLSGAISAGEVVMTQIGENVESIENTNSYYSATRPRYSGSEINLDKYDENLHTKGRASADCKDTAGQITTDNPTYIIVPDDEYTGEKGTISEHQFTILVAQVAGESANNYDDMLGVTSTVLNRMETGGDFGDNVIDVFKKGYWPWGKTYLAFMEGGVNYNKDWGQEKLAMCEEVVMDALNGARNINPDVYYYSGDGVNNYFSDKL